MADKCKKCKGTGWIAYTGRRGQPDRHVCQDCSGSGEKK